VAEPDPWACAALAIPPAASNPANNPPISLEPVARAAEGVFPLAIMNFSLHWRALPAGGRTVLCGVRNGNGC